MNLYLFTIMVMALIIGAGGICIAGTSVNPGDYPPYNPVEEPITIGPTDYPTSEPTFTVEPTKIGGDTGWVSVDSNPQGAEVNFDGSYQGITPTLITVLSTANPSHTIRVTKSGYQDWSGHISGNPGPGETIYQIANLVENQPTITVEPTSVGNDYGWLKIDSAPQGADVRVDDSYYGTSPALVKIMTAATPSHDIRITMNGYRDYVQHLSTNPGRDETIPIYASLVPLAQYGSISVTSDPSGALATLDSGTQYLTPCTFTQVVSGLHTITVNKAGYNSYTTQVQVNYNSQPRVYAPLTRFQSSGTLYVDSTPQGADVKIDNGWQGQTPQSVGNLINGYHTVRLQLSGYETVTQQVLITAGQETSFSPALVKNPPEVKTGSISVSSNPPGASVYLNADFQGVTPDSGNLDLTDITPGVYTIVLKAPQREEYSSTISVTAGQITPVNAELKAPVTPSAINGTLSVSSSPAGAQVLLDNIFVGITPLTLSSVKPGQYGLILKMGGYNDYSNQVQIAAGMSTTASVNLTPLQVLTATPTPAQTQARTPLPFVLVPAGLGAAFVLFRRVHHL